ncbi:hypothetical protein lerEdw1_013241 [Lerista edwardsae]|nr:hypothetical protein lerEdw1_013241 [Lerista edwardsae]
MRFTSALRGSIVGWRERFDSSGWDVARWFPGHMAKGMWGGAEGYEEPPACRGLLAGGARCSHILLGMCIEHIHIPLSGRTPLLQETLGIRPHLLVLNKMDLADLRHKSRILERLEQQGLRHVLFADCLKDENIKKIVPLVTELIGNSGRYHRAEVSCVFTRRQASSIPSVLLQNLETCLMVIGVPNVGKSSIINSMRRLHLRKGKASRVGGAPGITRAVLTKIQVCEQPLMFLLDTPGVLSPRIESVETGLKLALCGAIRDHLVGEETIADYLLYILNHQQQFSYVERYGLASPCDNVETVLKSIALHLGKTQRVKVLTGTGNVTVTAPNYNAAACEFIYSFRKGLLGKVMLDEVQS